MINCDILILEKDRNYLIHNPINILKPVSFIGGFPSKRVMGIGGLQELSMPMTKEEKQHIISEFAKGSQDTGSSQVQIALLTKNIDKLTEHCQKNPKDFSTRRGLLKMVCARRGFLKYLQKTDTSKYKEVIAKLGLRK